MSETEEDAQFYRDTESVAFRKIDDAQLALLEPLGERRVLQHGEMVYHAGQRDLPLTVVLRGEVEVYEDREGTVQILATPGPRDFIGDVAMLQGTSSLANARVKSDEAELLHVPAEKFRKALAELPGIGGMIVNAFIMRRRRLQRDHEFAGLRILSAREDRNGRHLHDFLTKNHVPHSFVRSDEEDGQQLARRYHLSSHDLPALIKPTGEPLRHPSIREVAQEAGLLRPLATAGETEKLAT